MFCADRAQLASPHPIVHCYSFILCAHGHLTATATRSISDSSQRGHRCHTPSPEGLQEGGSAAVRATRAIDARNPPNFLGTRCGDAARRAGRCEWGVHRVIMGLVGGLGEVVKGARRELALLGERKEKEV